MAQMFPMPFRWFSDGGPWISCYFEGPRPSFPMLSGLSDVRWATKQCAFAPNPHCISQL